MNRWEQPP